MREAGLRNILVFLLVVVCMAPANASDNPVHYTVSIPQPQTHLFHVEMGITGVEGPQVDLSMPVWWGAYRVQDFSANVVEFAAFDAEGNNLEWRKLDKNTWRIETGGSAAVTAKYVVYSREMRTTTSWVNSNLGHILGGNLFFWVDDDTGRAATLKLDLQAGWKVSAGAVSEPGDQTLFSFPSYHELIDTPMLIGTHREFGYEVEGIPHLVAVAGRTDIDIDLFVEDTKKIVEASADWFGGLPYEKYCFILVCSPNAGGGLEHANGTTMIVPDWRYPHKRLRWLTAHEYFHTWNVKRIQPPCFKPYDYDREIFTGFLWFSEGCTEYFTAQLLLRAGLWTREMVLDNYAELINEYRGRPGRLYESAYDGSFDTWLGRRRGENSVNVSFSYYPKGEIAGLIINFEMMQRTGGEKCFDDVLMAMWRRYLEEDAGFTTEDVRALCEEIAGGSFEQVFADYVYGVRDVPFEEYFPICGYRVIPDPERTAAEQVGAWLGARYSDEGGKVEITAVLRDTEAWQDGLNYGDEIISFGGVRIQGTADLDLQLRLRKPGEEVEVVVGRDGLVEALAVTMEEFPQPIYTIDGVREPREIQLKCREKWLGVDKIRP